MLRRVHLYELKKITSKIVTSVYYLIVNSLDKGGIVCGTCSHFCHRCCILVHEKCVRDSGWVRDNNCFCCRECMTGKVIYDEDGHYKNIKDSLCNFIVPFQGIVF